MQAQENQLKSEEPMVPAHATTTEGVADREEKWLSRKVTIDFSSPYNTRMNLKGDDGKPLNQSKFWAMFGVTQSGGSRYESGRSLPKSVKLLMALLNLDVIRPGALIRAGSYLKRCNKSTKEA